MDSEDADRALGGDDRGDEQRSDLVTRRLRDRSLRILESDLVGEVGDHHRPALLNRELDSGETRRVAEPVVSRCDPLGEHCRRLARLPQPDEAASDVER